MEKKTILFDGGPFHNQFREVPIDTKEVKYFEQPEKPRVAKLVSTGPVEIVTRYYKETSTKYGGIPVFVWIELKPTENESNNEVAEVTEA